jgi:hypothetical protein
LAVNAIEDKPLDASDIEMLLPWHAAGTLSRRDARRVEAALSADPELRRRYEQVREEFTGTIHVNETLGAPSARALETLLARIEAEAPRPHKPSYNLGAWLNGIVSHVAPRTLAYAGAAALIAIVLQAAVITGVVLKDRGAPGSGYVTASAPGAAAGSYAMVQFAPQASAADIAAFLNANKLRIVDGPNAAGMFKLRISAAALPQAALAQALKALQQDKAVAFIATTE